MIRAVVPFLALIALVGCSSVPERLPTLPAEQAWSLRKASLTGLARWVVSGRIAVRNENESWHANILWTQDPERYAISVIAPLGGGTFQLEGDSKGVQLRTPEDGNFFAENPDALVFDVVGLPIPVSGMRYWVMGVPQPGVAMEYDLDPWGRLRQLRQSTWQVDFLRYSENGEWELPDKVFMKNNQFEVRLVISEWSLDGVTTAERVH